MIKKSIPAVFALSCTFGLLSGCQITEEEKEQLKDAQVDLEQLADQVIVTYPANNSRVTDGIVTVRADVPEAANAQEVTLYVDGIEVAKDTDGAPWEIEWPAYFWGDDNSHSLLLKTVTGAGNEVRNNQQHQVSVSSSISDYLSLSVAGSNKESSINLIADTVPKATKYEFRLSNNGEERVVGSEVSTIEITDLPIGYYQAQYRAVFEVSDTTTIRGGWSKTVQAKVGIERFQFGGAHDDFANQIIKTRDGGILIRGETKSKDVDERVDSSGDDWLIKLNESGGVDWQLVMPAEGAQQMNDVVELSSGDFALVGEDWQSKQALLKIVSEQGRLLDSIAYSPDGASSRYIFTGVVEYKDKLVVAANAWGALDHCSDCSGIVNSYFHEISIPSYEVSDGYEIPSMDGLIIESIDEIGKSSNDLLYFSGTVMPVSSDSEDYWDAGAFIQYLDSSYSLVSSWDNANEYKHVNVGNVFQTEHGGLVVAGTGYIDSQLVLSIVDEEGREISHYRGAPDREFYRDGSLAVVGSNIYGLLKDQSEYDYPYPLVFIAITHDLTRENRTYLHGLKQYAYSAGVVANESREFTLVINEAQRDSENYDIVVIKRSFD